MPTVPVNPVKTNIAREGGPSPVVEQKSSYRLSREFQKYNYDPKTVPAEGWNLRSAAALALGVVPYAIAQVSLLAFRLFASLGSAAESNAVLRGLSAVPGLASAGILMASSKLFAWSQKVVWGDYVEKPAGDGTNTRLAQYGAGNKPWQDLQAIAKAFVSPQTLSKDEWHLEQWSRVSI